jgi:hypothetical protein
MNEFVSIAYLKYQGTAVEEGMMDMKKAALALTGFDDALRFALIQENPIFNEIDFEIPVKIHKGSWLVQIPDNNDFLIIKGALAWMAVNYFGSALSEMAKNDFKDFGFKDIFKSAIKSITWSIKLATHVKSMRFKKFDNVKFNDNNTLVGVPNEYGDYLYLPKTLWNL